MQSGETVHISSANGKETVAVRCGPDKVRYGIYDTNPKYALALFVNSIRIMQQWMLNDADSGWRLSSS
ncbi:unnamed protein product [Gongylonema pulchrum]|uniref:Bacteriophage protein n=1 Tax=Gongylonema pulchrum TaxID=637853 RepID=A0A183EX85_9BILA|nr:unnamed protein product [Gongylonema pulchrum]